MWLEAGWWLYLGELALESDIVDLGFVVPAQVWGEVKGQMMNRWKSHNPVQQIKEFYWECNRRDVKQPEFSIRQLRLSVWKVRVELEIKWTSNMKSLTLERTRWCPSRLGRGRIPGQLWRPPYRRSCGAGFWRGELWPGGSRPPLPWQSNPLA